MSNTRNRFMSLVAVSVLLSVASVRAEQADKYTRPHEPFTAPGMQVRMSIINPINKSWQQSYQPVVFQEIAPCRLTSTRLVDQYDMPWGGPSYQANESRRYMSRGVLETTTFVNPCSEAVPAEAIGVVGRFTVTPGDGDGEVHLDPTGAANSNATTVFAFKKGQVVMFEAGVMLAHDGSFDVSTWYAGADVMVDILGYFVPDPAPTTGPKGDKGDRGEKGESGATGATGATGVTGAKGDKGDQGEAGAIGPKGDKGETGATGATGAKGDKGDKGDQGQAGAIGPKGDRGETGATGAKGDKGDQGEAGAIGPKGDKGEVGATGATGAKGDKGDNGDTGATGATGAKGDTGATGPKGDKGDTGDTGAVGAVGPKGDKGDRGDAGLQGPMGPEGPAGPAGHDGHDGRDSNLTVIKGQACYPPGNNANSTLRVNDSSVTAGSIVILNYTDAGSNGNAQALVTQGAGYFETTGSPNRCFQYVVFNTAPAP